MIAGVDRAEIAIGGELAPEPPRLDAPLEIEDSLGASRDGLEVVCHEDRGDDVAVGDLRHQIDDRTRYERLVDDVAHGRAHMAKRGIFLEPDSRADLRMVAARNHHERQILTWSSLPGDFAPALEREARNLAHAIAGALDVVGLLCVELFHTTDGRLLVIFLQ